MDTQTDNKPTKTPKTGVKRPGSGRTAGSFSFVNLTLGELNAKFSDPLQRVVVGRKFAEACGFQNVQSMKVQDINGKIEGFTPETKVAAKVVEFE